jgi:hypothetical protein
MLYTTDCGGQYHQCDAPWSGDNDPWRLGLAHGWGIWAGVSVVGTWGGEPDFAYIGSYYIR